MKTTQFIILLLLLNSYSFCQDIKRIEKKFDKSKQVSEIYYVLKSDKTIIKQGEYISYFRLTDNDKCLIESGNKKKEDYVKEKGNYINNKKDGIWIEKNSLTKKDSGQYNNGQKIGVWDSYLYKEKISSYDYDNKKKVGIWLTFKENNRVIERYDYDKNIQLEPIIGFSISYPNIAKENGIQGIVRVRYHVNTDCTIDQYEIIQSLSEECDKEVLNAMKEYCELYKKYSKNCVDKYEEMDINFKLY